MRRIILAVAAGSLVVAGCSSNAKTAATTTTVPVVTNTALTTVAAPLDSSTTTTIATTTTAPGPAKVQHVFVINLENTSYDASFGAASKAPYLSKELTAKGALLTQYFGTSHASLGNYIAQISGQGANPQTKADCFVYKDFVSTGQGANGQEQGEGCVYPANVKTIADQLDAAKLTWKSYQEDMANSATDAKTCRHPAIGANDTTVIARVGDQYATRHNPFVYFHSIIDSPTCDTSVVDLKQMTTDLASIDTTANFNYITPNLCHDGHDNSCVDGTIGEIGGADEYLKSIVPTIMNSPAFKQDGLLIVTFDEAELSEPTPCCGEVGDGGGRVGAVLISPDRIKGGTVNDTPYNHFSLLCSIENIFGLGHLGFAGAAGLACFDSLVAVKP